MAAVKVLCVKWGSKYGPEWVYRLRSMVAKHLPVAHEFICLTDKPIGGVECRPLAQNLPSWWAKLNLFAPGIDGDKIYLDLDMVIRGDLSAIPACFDDSGKLWALDDFSYSLRDPKAVIDPETRRLLGGAGTVNSSVMAWRGDVAASVLTDFHPSTMSRLHGDQNWITQKLWPDGIRLFPDGIACSYKYHVMRAPSAAPVVVFHGNPKPNELERGNPLRQIWEAA